MSRYNQPSLGAVDWHIPLNSNFSDLGVDVEYRGLFENMSSIVGTPDEGKKFFATDTGEIYIGDGSEMVGPTLPEYFTEHAADTDLHGGTGSVETNTAVADGEETYSSVQDAIDNASSRVDIGPGTFTENITIDKPDIHVSGSGWDTTIDGGSETDADAITIGLNADDVIVEDLHATVSGAARNGVRSNESNTRMWLKRILVTGGGDNTGPSAFSIQNGNDKYINECRVTNWDAGRGIAMASSVTRGYVIFCRAAGVSNDAGIQIATDGSQIALNTVFNCDKGIVATGEAQVIFANVCHDTTDDTYRIRGVGQSLIGNRAWAYGDTAWGFDSNTTGLTRMGNVWSSTRNDTNPNNDGAPTTFVSETEPTEWREGDIWLEPEE